MEINVGKVLSIHICGDTLCSLWFIYL